MDNRGDTPPTMVNKGYNLGPCLYDLQDSLELSQKNKENSPNNLEERQADEMKVKGTNISLFVVVVLLSSFRIPSENTEPERERERGQNILVNERFSGFPKIFLGSSFLQGPIYHGVFSYNVRNPFVTKYSKINKSLAKVKLAAN